MTEVSKIDVSIYGLHFDKWFREKQGLSNPDREDKQIIDRIIKVYESKTERELSKPLRAVITAYVAGMNDGIDVTMKALNLTESDQ